MLEFKTDSNSFQATLAGKKTAELWGLALSPRTLVDRPDLNIRASIAFTPLHAFVGENASGKTRLLNALAEQQRAATKATPDDFLNNKTQEERQAIHHTLRAFFPEVKDIFRDPLRIYWDDGRITPLLSSSNGLGCCFVLAITCHGSAGKTVFIESPEEGLDPRRIVIMMKLLRERAERGSPVVITTHSPLVLNELEPPEVSVVTRRDGLIQTTPIAETPDFEERSKVYALGELWLLHTMEDA